MAQGEHDAQWRTDGKFFRAGSSRVWMKAVTYGPFPGGWPISFDSDFSQIAAAGFNCVRLFDMPDDRLLTAARDHGLKVFAGLKWGQNADFLMRPGLFTAAQVSLANSLAEIGNHPALAGVYVGNEVPADLARWMGPVKVLDAIENLIAQGKELAPHLLFAYASYPSTEYLEPENADFTAFNVYLEDETAFRSYIKRLHHIAGDRPLVISEFGLDSRRNGLERQAEVLDWSLRAARESETTGMTIYAWSDRWWNNDAEVLDWDFGLIDRRGNAKPSLAVCRADSDKPLASGNPLFSVIICSRNGRGRIRSCLEAVGKMRGGGFETIVVDGGFETIVVDDGSNDGMAEFVETHFPGVRLLVLEPSGLSAARNAGANIALGKILAFTDDDCEPDEEWIARLRSVFYHSDFAAVGGPNLPPKPRNWEEAVVCAAPGAPSHVMLDDTEAEHLPGCNLVVRKDAFLAIHGFDPIFHTAGDDVDFCWRLRDAGFRLGFSPGAFVWHQRRPTVLAFLRQQLGYGRAERLLMKKHPSRFSKSGHAKWLGFVYGGGPVRVTSDSIIYHGPMGNAGYQGIMNRMLPLRGLEKKFNSLKARLALLLVNFLQPQLRAWARNHRLRFAFHRHLSAVSIPDDEFEIHSAVGNSREDFLKLLTDDGWKSGGVTDTWDAEKDGNRVLVATEHGENGAKTTLVRIWGNPSALPSPLRGR